MRKWTVRVRDVASPVNTLRDVLQNLVISVEVIRPAVRVEVIDGMEERGAPPAVPRPSSSPSAIRNPSKPSVANEPNEYTVWRSPELVL